MTLRETLDYAPVELAFGTSGLRGLAADITQLEAYVNTRGFLACLLRRRRARRGDAVYCAGDLRPSTDRLVPESGGRGEILQAVLRAVEDSRLSPAHLGRIPSPALLGFARRRRAAGVMVTGSHIPFDRNGIKFSTPAGEVLKYEEAPILEAVRQAREAEYRRPAAESLFDGRGMLKAEHRRPLPPASLAGAEEYARRYLQAFPAGLLTGARLLVWQHSAVGRDLLVQVLRALGAEVTPAGRSETFVPIDTEAVDEPLLAAVQALVDAGDCGPAAGFQAVVSTDGDGDRPLLLAVEGGRVRFVPGDLLGLLAADYLGAREVAVPVSASDAVELHLRPRGVRLCRTRIGSPYLIAALREVGWEGNGGFLTAAPLRLPGGGLLEPLPTRDSLLPILCVLAAARGQGLGALLDRLPPRFGRSALLRPFARERFLRLAAAFAPPRPDIVEARFGEDRVTLVPAGGKPRALGASEPAKGLQRVRARLEEGLAPEPGLGRVAWINWLDGLRIGFESGQIAHLRASGNAPELRAYAVAGSQEAADRLARNLLQAQTVSRLEALAARRQSLAALAASPRPLALRGSVQHYPWGGRRFLPDLLGRPNQDDRPWAELWLGAHPRAPSAVRLEPDEWLPLDRLLREAPAAVLGPARRAGDQLPFLLKVLDARDMLSIQVHPAGPQARAGFARENAAGLPPDSPQRSYPDPNPKLEVHAALSRMWLLHGFRPPEEIGAMLQAVPELGEAFADLRGRLRHAGRRGAAPLRELLTRITTLPQEEVDRILDPLLARLEKLSPSDKSSSDYWALRASRLHPLPGGHRDRGILWIYLLNLLCLEPGEGTFQPPGLPHAYLEGATVELMSSSDNVLRAGLTAKKIDSPELLRALDFRGTRSRILRPRALSPVEWSYPAPGLRLARLELPPGRVLHRTGRGPACLLLLEGAAALEGGGRRLELARGGAALVPPGLPCGLRALGGGRAVLYRAGA